VVGGGMLLAGASVAVDDDDWDCVVGVSSSFKPFNSSTEFS
jgi:hypothetical protein